jgi:subtilisin family serine protease
MRKILSALLFMLLLGAVTAQAAGPQETDRFVIQFKKEKVAAAAARSLVEAHGGTLYRDLSDLGMVIAQSTDAGFAAAVAADSSVHAVRRERLIEAGGRDPYATSDIPEAAWAGSVGAPPAAFDNPMAATVAATATVTAQDLLNAPFFRFGFQWDLTKIQADQAWLAGGLGDPAVKVAIVSSGIDYTHPELAGKVDLDLSVSFVPSDDILVQQLFPGAHPVADLGIHGTYVASLIACNAFGQACGAANVTLIGVKVLNFAETGTIGDLASGVRYAASVGADIIVLPDDFGIAYLSDPDGRNDILTLRRAVNYAWSRGSLVLGATWTPFGELGLNADGDGDRKLLPSQAGTMAVGATGTQDQWSGISSYGHSLIEVAGPGGQVDLDTRQPPPGVFIFSVGVCSSFTQEPRFGLPAVCNKQSGPQYIFSFGVRPAVAHAASVAALIESRWGGSKKGSFVRARLRNTADDILDPGVDAVSGHGRVNALRGHTE